MRLNKTAHQQLMLMSYHLDALKTAQESGMRYEAFKRATEHLIHTTTLFTRELWKIKEEEDKILAHAGLKRTEEPE